MMKRLHRKKHKNRLTYNVNPVNDAQQIELVEQRVRVLRQQPCSDQSCSDPARDYLVKCLYEFSKSGSIAVCEFILKSGGIHPDLPMKELAWDQSSIHGATRHGQIGSIDLLLKFGANVDMPDGLGHTSLYIAVLQQDRKCVRCLLQHGANPNAVSSDGTPLDRARQLANGRDLVEMMLAHCRGKADLNKSETCVQQTRSKFTDWFSWLLPRHGNSVSVNQNEGEPLQSSVDEELDEEFDEVETVNNTQQACTDGTENLTMQVSMLQQEYSHLKNELKKVVEEVVQLKEQCVCGQTALCVSDPREMFLHLANQVGKDWRMLGRWLALDEHYLDNIEIQYKSEGLPEFSFRVLQAWHTGKGCENSWCKLIDVMQKANMKNLSSIVQKFVRKPRS